MHAKEWVQLPCDLCGGEAHTTLFVKEDFRHVRCDACGLVFVNPRLAGHAESQRLSGTGAMGEDQLTGRQVRRLRRELQALEPYRALNRILEVGAGRGWFLAEAGLDGWETWAVEINQDAVAHLHAKGIRHIVTDPAETFAVESASVDVVRMWDVIEHLESPRAAIANVFRVLRPGGLMRLSTTNFGSLSRRVNGPEWVYLNGADHIFLFEPSTITALLLKAGFVDVRIRTRSFNLRRKLYYPERTLPPRTAVLIPFRKLIDEAVRFTRLGHQMIVTCRKPAPVQPA